MSCIHAPSGCNYPEAHCLGLCDSARRTCAARGLVLTMPAGVQADPAALRREFGAQGIQYNWHPSQDVHPRVLHLTCMHPEDLRSAGCTDFIERGWQGRGRQAARSGQQGRITLPFALHAWALALMFGLLMGFGQLLDGPTDHEAAQDAAASATDTPRSAAEQLRHDRALEAMALRAAQERAGGPEAVPERLADGSIQWRTRRGHKTVKTPAPTQPASQQPAAPAAAKGAAQPEPLESVNSTQPAASTAAGFPNGSRS